MQHRAPGLAAAGRPHGTVQHWRMRHPRCWAVEGLLLALCLLGAPLRGAGPNQKVPLHQPPVVRALRGESVTLTCSCQLCDFPDFYSEWHFAGGGGNPGPPALVAVKTSIASRPLDLQQKYSVTHQRNVSSLLLINNLQPNDSGTYRCTLIRNIPPPTKILKPLETELEVYALPKVWLFSSSAKRALHSVLVTCAATEFYPASLNITLNVTCGGYQVLGDGVSVAAASQGTFNATQRAWVDTADCHNGTEVTCWVRQLVAEVNQTLWIPPIRNTAVLSMPVFINRFLISGLVISWLICLLGCFRKSTCRCGKRRAAQRPHPTPNHDLSEQAPPASRQPTGDRAGLDEVEQVPSH